MKPTENDSVKAPVWKNFSAEAWFCFVTEFRDYRSQGGSLVLGRCVSVNCKTLCKLEFAFDRWKRDEPTKEEKTKTDAKKTRAEKDVEKETLLLEEETFDNEVILTLSAHFAPVSSFVAESKFRKLRMTVASLADYRAYVLAFASMESQCLNVMPPPKTLAKIFCAGVLPAPVRDRLISTECADWADARAQGFSMLKDLERLSYLSGAQVRSTTQVESVVTSSSEEQKSLKEKLRATRSCFSCHKQGHFAKNCPGISAAVATAEEPDYSDVSVSWPFQEDWREKIAKELEDMGTHVNPAARRPTSAPSFKEE